MLTFIPNWTSGAIRSPFAGSARSCIAPIARSVSVRNRVWKHYPSALRPDAPRRSFQQADHAQTQLPVADRRLAVADALGKVRHHALQRLAGIDLRAPDVAAAIPDQQLAPLLGALAHVDAAVVHFDRLGRVQLV